MAEVIGAISGSIAIGTVIVQFTNSLIALKECVDQVRDAPDDLKRLLQSIEIAGFVLADIEEDLAQDDGTTVSVLRGDKHVRKSLELCVHATKTLEDISRELVRDIQPPGAGRLRKHYAGVKVMLQRSKVEKYMAVLQNALQLLQVSQQCYLRAMMRVQPELIVQKMAQSAKSITYEEPPPYAKVSSQIIKKTTGEMQQKRVKPTSRWSYLWNFRMPAWLTSKALEVTARRFPGGWDWQLRVYREVPWDSEVIQYTIHGDIAGLQRLFASGQATPFDQLEGLPTRGLLGYTFGGTNETEIFEFLVSQGADIQSSGNDIDNTLGHLVWSRSMGGITSSLLPSFHALLNHMPDVIYDTEEEVLEGVLNEYHGTAEEFPFLQRELCPSFYSMSQGTRTAVAIEAASGHWDACHLPETIRAILGPDPLTAEIFQLEKQLRNAGCGERTTLVHCVSKKIGQNLAMMQRREYVLGIHRDSVFEDNYFGVARSRYALWNGLFREFMGNEADMHRVVDGMTPFLSFLVGYIKLVELERFSVTAWKTGFREWLKDLQTTGVDLQKFGAKEKRIWAKKLTESERQLFSLDLQNSVDPLDPWLRPLIGFDYGPSPDDWDIWVSERSDHYAGEFWEMIEMEPEVMPGAWPVE